MADELKQKEFVPSDFWICPEVQSHVVKHWPSSLSCPFHRIDFSLRRAVPQCDSVVFSQGAEVRQMLRAWFTAF